MRRTYRGETAWRRIGTALCAIGIVAALGSSAFAGGFKLIINIGRPTTYQPPVVYTPPVVVYQPAPVVYQPVVLTPPPVVMRPPTHYPPVAQQPIVVYPQPVVVQQPVYQQPMYQQPVYRPPVYQPPVYRPPVYQLPVRAPVQNGIRYSTSSQSRDTFRSGHYVYEPVKRSNGSTTYRRTWRND